MTVNALHSFIWNVLFWKEQKVESVQEIRADQADIVISLYLYLTVYCYSSRSLGENKYLLAKYILIWYEVAVMQYIYVKVVYLATNYFKLLMKTVDELGNWFWYAQAEEGVGFFVLTVFSFFFISPHLLFSFTCRQAVTCSNCLVFLHNTVWSW